MPRRGIDPGVGCAEEEIEIRRLLALVPIVVALGGLALQLAGCARSTVAPPARSPGLAGRPDGAPLAAPAEAIRSPNGRWIVPGTTDELGWELPLDRVPGEPLPGRPAGRPAGAARSSTAGPRGSGFPETRLGPDDGHTHNETAIDLEGEVLVAGWNQFTDTSLVMGVARSTDLGASWTWTAFTEHAVTSDPSVAAGGDGRWYYGYLARDATTGSDTEIFVRGSSDDGATWSPPVAVTANASFDDKPYVAASGDDVLVAWADFGFSPAKIRAARSLDGGASFDHDTVLANASVGGNGASPVISPDGSWYVFWRDSFQQFLWMAKSTDRGETWSPDSPVAAMSPLPPTLPGGFRIVNLPAGAAGPGGELVVVWNDQAFGDPDILAVRSTDGGASWSAPVRVNDDPGGAAQFFPWVAIDADGRVHVVWYDRRQNGFDIDLYHSASADGGASFGPDLRVTAASFPPVLPWEPGASPFIGDYNAVAAGGGAVYAFFQDSREGDQDVYVAVLGSPLLFADGFESGDVSAWSSSVP